MARKIELEITGDTRNLERALSRASGKTKSTMDKVTKSARIAGLALAGGLAVGAKVGFDELAEGQKVAAQTAAVLKSTGGAANVTASHVDTLAASLSNLSGVDDELIGASENVLLTFRNVHNEVGKGNNIFDQATAAALDLSVAMDTDLSSAALMVGKALNDPARGLQKLERQGVTFTAGQKELITSLVESGDVMAAQKIILEELNTEFGGSAKAAGETLPGQLNKARNAFDEVAGSLVESLLPAVTAVLAHLTTFTTWAKENPDKMKLVVIAVGALAAALLTASVAQTILNLAVLANPYVAAVVAIGVFVGALVLLARKFDWVRQHWQVFMLSFGVFPVVVATIVKAAIRNFDKLKAAFGAVEKVARVAFAAVAAHLRVVLGPLLTLIAAAERLLGLLRSIGGAEEMSNPFTGPGTGAGPRGAVPHPSYGGAVLRSGLAHIHKGEQITRASVVQRGGTSGSSRGRYVVMGDREFVDWLRAVDGGERRRNGGRGIL